MTVKSAILAFILAGFLSMFAFPSGEGDQSNGNLYIGEIKTGKVTLIGYLKISHITETEHNHDSPGHQDPVKDCPEGSQYRAVFTSKAGNIFFDMIYCNDKVTQSNIIPSIREKEILEKIKQLVYSMIKATKAGQPKEKIDFSDPGLDLSFHFTAFSYPEIH